MTELVILAVLSVVVTSALCWLVLDRVRDARTAVRHRVVVNLAAGQALNAVLWARRGRLLVLRDAALLEPGAEPVRMDGEVLLDRDQVLFVQAFGDR